MYEDPMPDARLVERLHALLAQALLRNRHQPFDSPVTVAEIYQDLVPYRNVRTALGLQMNADYEHTLLRMLSGEGGLARLEPAEARDELRTELDTPNPNVGLFRKFAACDVWVTPAEPEDALALAPAGDSPAAPAGAGPEAAEAAGQPEPGDGSGRDLEEWDASLPELILEEIAEPPSPETVAVEPPPESPPAEINLEPEATTMFETPASPAVRPGGHGASCAFCASDLPAGRTVKFCPFCGADQALRPCVSCSEPLEPDWRFCIACGSRQDAA